MRMQTQEASRERRGGSQGKLNTLLQTRTETLTLFSQLVGIRPFNPDQELHLLLQEFCETLVDYTASAHFQLYRFLEDGSERRGNIKNFSASVYPRISDSTQLILDFNEKYESEDRCKDFSSLDDDLSKLGEALADRIQMEDQIIAALSVSR